MRQLTRAQLFNRARAAGMGNTFTVPHADLYVARRYASGDDRYELRHQGSAEVRTVWAPAPPDWRPDAGQRVNWRRPNRNWQPAPIELTIDVRGATATFEASFASVGDQFQANGTLIAPPYRLDLYAPDGAGEEPSWFNRVIDGQIASLSGRLREWASHEGVGMAIGNQVIAGPPVRPARLGLSGTVRFRQSEQGVPDYAPGHTVIGSSPVLASVAQFLGRPKIAMFVLYAQEQTTMHTGLARWNLTSPGRIESFHVGDVNLLALIDSMVGTDVQLWIFDPPVDARPLLEPLLGSNLDSPSARIRAPFVDLDD